MKALLLPIALSLAAVAPEARAESLAELTRKVIALEERIGFYNEYMRNYHAGIPLSGARAMDCNGIFSPLREPRFLFIGDVHDRPDAVNLLERAVRDRVEAGEKPAIVIEFIFRSHQGIVDSYLAGQASLSDVRRVSQFDKFRWAWTWEDISRTLVIGKELGLPVIAAEEGSNDIYSRDAFTAEVIRADAVAHPTRTYVVLYGTAHMMGRDSIPDRVSRFDLGAEKRVISFLGRLTERAAQAAGSETAACLLLPDGNFYENSLGLRGDLEHYYAFLRRFGRGTR